MLFIYLYGHIYASLIFYSFQTSYWSSVVILNVIQLNSNLKVCVCVYEFLIVYWDVNECGSALNIKYLSALGLGKQRFKHFFMTEQSK